ncbi:MAG TPA: hypothetical protein VKE96_27025 [Vicinamibacterales bacterium]|nr:hypothetical protein [Vicinamibacterales bacterium]
MSPSHEIAVHDQQLVRYLLGQLPPDDADRIDELSVVDDDIAARLRVVEDDLVDAYVRGALSGDTLKRFESHYLSSPLRRERVAFARSFVSAVDRAQPPAARTAPMRAVRPRWISALSVAAAVLLAACAGLLLQSIRLGRGLKDAERARIALDQRTRDLERQIAELRAPNQTVASEREHARESSPAPPQEPLRIALVLLPQTRAIGPVPTLRVPPGAARIGFELRLESNDYSRYQVGLRDPAANTTVWRSGWAAARSSGAGSAVVVALPSELLKPQHYTFDLAGRGPDGGAEVVGSYTFEIVPR